MIGSRVGGWQVEAEIGRGPVGTVYRARSAEDGRPAAVKVYTHPATFDPAFQQRFPAEMLALRRLRHPNIVAVYDCGVHAGMAYYAAELVDGRDCGSLLKTREKGSDGPGLGWRDEVISIAAQAARALKHGHHRSVLHRDLKPGNFLLARDGTLKLADFGVSKVFNVPPLTLPADGWGTAGFLAPEHFTGKPLTRRSDLYALGGVIYTLLTGRPPFAAATAAEFLHKHCYTLPDRPAMFVPKLPPDLDELVCGLLAKDPGRRPATAAAVLDDLDRLRGKLERKGERIAWPAGVTDPTDLHAPLPPDAGAATDDEPEYRPLLRRPVVVVPLFLLVVGALLAAFFWPKRSADELFSRSEPLRQSADPADWDKAWDEYLEPLSRHHPDQYAAEVAAFRERMLAHKELRRALAQGGQARYSSEGERLYHRGLAFARSGDAANARATWQAVAAAFAVLPGERRWADLARAGLDELAKGKPSASGSADPSRTGPAVAAVLEEVARMRAAGRVADADAVSAALGVLYADDPAAVEAVRRAK